MTYEQDFSTFEAFAKAVKLWRGHGWVFYSGTVAGRKVQLKTYNHTYMQIYRIDGLNAHLSPMDCTVGAFSAALALPFAS